ncbi:MAG: virulence-associated E family protein, partial [Patescibacteria group bacterium]
MFNVKSIEGVGLAAGHEAWLTELFSKEIYAGLVKTNSLDGLKYTDHPLLAKKLRLFSDNDYTRIIVYLQNNGILGKVTRSKLIETISYISSINTFNPIIDYLGSISWDGEPRVDNFLTKYVSLSDDNYNRQCSKSFWLGMVARSVNHGCKYENMIILEGRQGVGKSKMLAMIGGEWFKEASGDVHNKDFILSLQGAMLVEVPEMHAVLRSDPDIVKAMISNCHEIIRRPYGREYEQVKRSSILVGTTNRDNYLLDDTGSRRFFPVLVSDKIKSIDIDDMAKNRDQLFAEAFFRYSNKENYWHVDSDAQNKINKTKYHYDEWETVIRDRLIKNNGAAIVYVPQATVWTVWTDCFNGDPDRLDRKTQIRISGILKKIGYKRRRTS